MLTSATGNTKANANANEGNANANTNVVNPEANTNANANAQASNTDANVAVIIKGTSIIQRKLSYGNLKMSRYDAMASVMCPVEGLVNKSALYTSARTMADYYQRPSLCVINIVSRYRN